MDVVGTARNTQKFKKHKRRSQNGGEKARENCAESGKGGGMCTARMKDEVKKGTVKRSASSGTSGLEKSGRVWDWKKEGSDTICRAGQGRKSVLS